jgi:hypothetical protein
VFRLRAGQFGDYGAIHFPTCMAHYGFLSTDLRLKLRAGCGLGLELPLVSSAWVPVADGVIFLIPLPIGRWPVRPGNNHDQPTYLQITSKSFIPCSQTAAYHGLLLNMRSCDRQPAMKSLRCLRRHSCVFAKESYRGQIGAAAICRIPESGSRGLSS